jgi:hypothetical protein
LADDMSADIFLLLITFFYRREQQYDKEGLTPKEKQHLKDLDAKEILISLREYLKNRKR